MAEDTQKVSAKKEGSPSEKTGSQPSKAEKKDTLPTNAKAKVKVRNIGKRIISLNDGHIKPGETGTCTVAIARSYRKHVEVIG